MERKHAVKQHSESGMTLVEILASIVILTIILSIVFMVFIQTAKTTNTTDETIDATYIGQKEMERVYAASKQKDLSFEGWEPKGDFTQLEPETQTGPDITWSKVYQQDPYIEDEKTTKFRVKMTLAEDDGMVRVLIRVYGEDKENPLVQMENLYLWEGDQS